MYCNPTLRLTPHGVGGLKFPSPAAGQVTTGSHPTRGGWIEIFAVTVIVVTPPRLTPHGVGGLKYRLTMGD